MARYAPRWAPLAALVLACNPTARTMCACDAPPPELREDMRGEALKAAELAAPLVGARLVVKDDALGTSWRALEPGVAGWHGARTTIFDEHASEPFRWFFGLDAEREDTKEQRQIEIAVTFVPDEQGPRAVAIELSAVGGGTNRGEANETRTFWACPQGETIHYARFAPGDSPCHHVPLVPILRCGCDDDTETLDAARCAEQDRTAIKKMACVRKDGVPIPK